MRNARDSDRPPSPTLLFHAFCTREKDHLLATYRRIWEAGFSRRLRAVDYLLNEPRDWSHWRCPTMRGRMLYLRVYRWNLELGRLRVKLEGFSDDADDVSYPTMLFLYCYFWCFDDDARTAYNAWQFLQHHPTSDSNERMLELLCDYLLNCNCSGFSNATSTIDRLSATHFPTLTWSSLSYDDDDC